MRIRGFLLAGSSAAVVVMAAAGCTSSGTAAPSTSASAVSATAVSSGGAGTLPTSGAEPSVTAAGSAAGGGATAKPTVGSGAAANLNIVFVLTDDLSWNLVSHMPHVMALQRAGLTMSNHYVVDSLCCPSRSAIFTGEYPHDDGVFTNTGADGGYSAYNSNGNQNKTFALALQKVGYRTAFMGKYLNGYTPTEPVPPGWNEWDVTGNGYKEFNYTLNENGKQQHYGKAPADYLTDVMSTKASSFIDSAAADKTPFMLELATFAPHAPYAVAPRFKNAAAGVPYPKTAAYDVLPTNAPAWLAGRPPLTSKQQAMMTTDYQKRIEADMATDDMIGHLEQELQAKGLANNTYIVFTSDNGYHMGEYRFLPGKQTTFDTDIHVPLIVSGPGVAAGSTATDLTSNIDFAPTFESLTGAAVGATVDGLDMTPIFRGQTPAEWPQAVLVEHHGPDDNAGDPDRQTKAAADPPSYEAIRTATALYVRYTDGEAEYYDTATDPLELHNLGGSAAPTTVTAALTALQNCHTAATCRTAAHL